MKNWKDTIVTVNGLSKRLGDCTIEDLRWLEDDARREAQRLHDEARQLEGMRGMLKLKQAADEFKLGEFKL